MGPKCRNRHLMILEKLPAELRGFYGGLTRDLQEIGGSTFFFGDGGETGERRGRDGGETGDRRVGKRRAAGKGGGPPATSRSETLSCFGVGLILHLLIKGRKPASGGRRSVGPKCRNRHLIILETLPAELRASYGRVTGELRASSARLVGRSFFLGDGGETGERRGRDGGLEGTKKAGGRQGRGAARHLSLRNLELFRGPPHSPPPDRGSGAGFQGRADPGHEVLESTSVHL